LITGTKRFNRQGLVISVLGHVGILAVALFFLRASSQEAMPPDAMQVELVTPKEMPRYSGTPSMARTSGTEQEGQPQAQTEQSQQPPPVAQPPQPKDQQQAQRDAPRKSQQTQNAPPQTKDPPLPPADAAQVTMPQQAADPPAPAAQDTPDASSAAATAAQLALMGGPLGGGFAAPPVDSPVVGYDFTVPFRELVSSCATLPPGIGRNEKLSVTLRVYFNRDGTLAAAPRLLDANPSPKQQALMQSFAGGLQKCQPYTMLPPDQYKLWKTLDLVVFPNNYLAP
jgi:hypothetical protein